MLFAQALSLERREETLHGGVVPAVSTTAHAAYDAVRLKQTLEVLAGVLGGFNWRSQHLIVGEIVSIYSEPRQVSPNQGFSVACYSTYGQRL